MSFWLLFSQSENRQFEECMRISRWRFTSCYRAWTVRAYLLTKVLGGSSERDKLSNGSAFLFTGKPYLWYTSENSSRKNSAGRNAPSPGLRTSSAASGPTCIPSSSVKVSTRFYCSEFHWSCIGISFRSIWRNWKRMSSNSKTDSDYFNSCLNIFAT